MSGYLGELRTKRDFYMFGKKKGLSGPTLKRYADFMPRAFPPSSYCTVPSYAEEWVERFMKPDPRVYMGPNVLGVYEGRYKKNPSFGPRFGMEIVKIKPASEVPYNIYEMRGKKPQKVSRR